MEDDEEEEYVHILAPTKTKSLKIMKMAASSEPMTANVSQKMHHAII